MLRIIQKFFTACLLFAGIAVGSGCDQSQPAVGKPSAPPIKVITSAYVMAEMVRTVGGDAVTLDWLMEAGDAPRIDQPTPQQRTRAREASLVIAGAEASFATGGGGTQPGVGTPTLRPDETAVRIAAKSPNMLPSEAGEEGHGAVWLVPAVSAELATTTAEVLARQRMDLTETFRANATALVAELDKEAAALAAARMPKSLVVLEPTFAPLLRTAGIRQVYFDANLSALDDRTRRELSNVIRSTHAAGLIVPADLPQGTQRSLAQSLSTRIVPLDALGSSRAGERDTLLKVMAFNRRSLEAAGEE